MYRIVRCSPKLRALFSKLGSLLLLFQRAPLIKMLFPEARVLAGAGIGELTKWTVAAYAGLSAYDGVAGATTIAQNIPTKNSLTVNTAVGSNLVFVYQVSGSLFLNNAGSWVTTTLPPGLVHTPVPGTPLTSDSITGTPTQQGSFPVTVTVRDKTNPGTYHPSQDFTIVVGPAIIATQPASTSIQSGTTTTLTVVGSGTPLTYQWYQGTAPSTTNLISGATSASFTTPALTSDTSYWVKVTRSGVVANSTTATVTILPAGTAPAITTQPASTTISSGATTTLTVAASGTSPTFQWYQGDKGVTTSPVAGATATTLTTPTLTATTSFWARATNALGTADSDAAVVTVTPVDPFVTWQAGHFTADQLNHPEISGADADPDGDGVKNSDEYVFGTLPLTPDGQFTNITAPDTHVSVTFTAKLATGPGYEGKTRHYAIDTRPDLTTGDWTAITGFDDIVGSDQPVDYTVPRLHAQTFYRVRVWLTP